MNLDTYEKLNINHLNTSFMPTLKGAIGHDMLAKGITTFDFTINKHTFTNSFIVCTKMSRPIILGRDFTIPNIISVGWTRHGTKRLCMDDKLVLENENFEGKTLALSRSIHIPPRCTTVAEVSCLTDMNGKFQVQPSPIFLGDNPNMYCKPIIYDMSSDKEQIQQQNLPDLPTSKEHAEINNIEPMNTTASPQNKKTKKPQQICTRIPFFITNLSSTSRVVLPKDHVMAFITPENPEMNYTEIAEVQSIEEECRNWKHATKMLPKAPESDFLVSPGDVNEVRRCVLSESDISDETHKSFHQLLDKYQAAFSNSSEDIGHTELITMNIDTGMSQPVSQRPYTLLLKHHDWVKKEIKQIEHAGVIEKSLSPWASPIVIVPKKSGPGEPPKRRMCLDYHQINALQTEVDSSSRGCMSLYPLPKIDKMFNKLCDAKIFTTLDLRSGYFHIGLTDAANPKTAFVTPHGKWHFNMVPFSLAQVLLYFQQLMNQVFQGLDFAIAYLDIIVIFSNNELEHLQHLETVFKRLQDAGLKLKESKCNFFRSQIHYLGHMLSAEGIQPLPEKLDSITNMPAPENQTEVKQFLGLVGYYHKFVPHFSDISRPLAKLMRKDTPFTWMKQCHLTFNMLKDKLCEAPILHYPDSSKPYTLFTDTSKHGWAGVLTQEFETEVKGKVLKETTPIAYISGLFHGSQLNWAALTKEVYAI